jgi:hypothetical protein
MPLFSCSGVALSDLGFISCCNVLVFLKAIFMFVFLNRFVIFLIWGLKYVNVVQVLIVLLPSVCWRLCLCSVCKFILCSSCGKLLFLAIRCIVSEWETIQRIARNNNFSQHLLHSVNVKFRVRELPYYCVGHSVLFKAQYPRPLFIVVKFDSLR